MAKVQRGTESRNEWDDALADVARALGRWAAEHGEASPPAYVLAAVSELCDARDAAGAEESTISRREARETGLEGDNQLTRELKHEADRGGRHDAKRVSGGREYAGGMLLPVATGTLDLSADADAKTRERIRAIVGKLTRMERHALTSGDVEAIDEAFELLFERPPTWESELTTQLEWDEHHREEARLREVHGDEPAAGTYMLGDWTPDPKAGAALGPANGAQILRAILARSEVRGFTVPEELTAEAIDAMRERTGAGGGGAGKKKKARNVVADFAKTLAKLRRGNSRK